MNSQNNKVIFVASPGGHFVQMSMLAANFDNKVIISTYKDCPSFVETNSYYKIQDFNRNNFLLLFPLIFKALGIVRKEKPNIVITTGAAPGLVFVILARFLGIKALWIDSIANTQKISLSGKIARFFGIKVLTQWRNLADNNSVFFEGRVI